MTTTSDEDDRLHKAIGQRIMAWRKGLGVVRADLAECCGMDYYTLARIERGQRVKIAKILRIAEAMNMPLEALFRGER